MVLLALLIHIPVRWLTAISVAVIALHNLADRLPATSFGKLAWIWNILHQPGAFTAGGVLIVVGYPLLPLVATMAAGYCMGHLFQMEDSYRRRVLLLVGIGMSAAFVLVRLANIYGDPFPWKTQG